MPLDPIAYAAALQAYLLSPIAGTNPDPTAQRSPQYPVGTGGRSIDGDQVAISGEGQLIAAITEFEDAMLALSSPDQIAPVSVRGSNDAVALGAAGADAALGAYHLTVVRLAQNQSVQSAVFADASDTPVGTGTLIVTAGAGKAAAGPLAPGFRLPAAVPVVDGTLAGIAQAINRADAGIAARVVQDQTGFRLVLTSTGSGAASGFSVGVAVDPAGPPAAAGLSRLTYLPNSEPGPGAGLTLIQAPQDARYLVNGRVGTSETNQSVMLGRGVVALLRQLGSTTISVGPDQAVVAFAAQRLVDNYNALLQIFAELAGPAGALAGDPILEDLARELVTMAGQSFGGIAGASSSLQIGIALQRSGRLVFNSDPLRTALEADLADAATGLAQAAQRFAAWSQQLADQAVVGSSDDGREAAGEPAGPQPAPNLAQSGVQPTPIQAAEQYAEAILAGYASELTSVEAMVARARGRLRRRGSAFLFKR